MGYYSEYLNKNLSFEQLNYLRKEQLNKISQLRGNRDVLVYAADLRKGGDPISIDFSDRLPIKDQLDNLNGTSLDLILETPGGSGEVAEDIVRAIRQKYDHVSVIIPGAAMSAGTIIALSANDILMEPGMSSLGPIDAQLINNGKRFSAHALLEGFRKIKEEVEEKNDLNKAYIPILQALSPGELEHAQNALNFAKVLVTEWLDKYKFRDWERHSSTGKEVTPEERMERAKEVAELLCDHGRWKSHSKSIKLSDLESMRLKIIDFSEKLELEEAIQRYYTLLQMSFSTNLYKLIETPSSQIFRFGVPQVKESGVSPENAKSALLDVKCEKCQTVTKLQANLEKGIELAEGCIIFPENDILTCSGCGQEINLVDARRSLESQAGRRLVN